MAPDKMEHRLLSKVCEELLGKIKISDWQKNPKSSKPHNPHTAHEKIVSV